MIELKYSLIRISRALKPTFWLMVELKKEIQVQQKIVDRENVMRGGNAVSRAKKAILDREKQFYLKYTPWSSETIWRQWDEFKFYKQKQWEKDREKKIWLKK